MAMQRITFKTGPLKGKTVNLHSTTTRHPVDGGMYKFEDGKASWHPAKVRAAK